jgi:hypothetical protein
MIRRLAEFTIWPNVPLKISVSGLQDSTELKILKNSNRSSSSNLSCDNGVRVFDSDKSALVRLGPRRKFGGSVPMAARTGNE